MEILVHQIDVYLTRRRRALASIHPTGKPCLARGFLLLCSVIYEAEKSPGGEGLAPEWHDLNGVIWLLTKLVPGEGTGASR